MLSLTTAMAALAVPILIAQTSDNSAAPVTAAPNEFVIVCYLASVDPSRIGPDRSFAESTTGPYKLFGVAISPRQVGQGDRVSARIYDPNLMMPLSVESGLWSADGNVIAVNFGPEPASGWLLTMTRGGQGPSRYAGVLIPDERARRQNPENWGYYGSCGSDIPISAPSAYESLANMPLVIERR